MSPRLALLLLFPPLAAVGQEESADGGAPASSGSADAGAEGPHLELEGLPELSSPAAAEAAATEQQAEVSYERRLAPTADLAQRAAAILDRTTLGGYAEHDFILSKGGRSTFRNHRYVLFVYSQISEQVSTATEVEFEFAGSPLKRDGILGAGEVLLEFSVVDVKVADWLVFRAGVILVPVSAYNLRHDAAAQELPERPIAYTTVVPTTWFESGAGVLGQLRLPLDMRLSYELYAVNGLDARIFDVQGLRGARGSHLEDNNHDKAILGRVALSPRLGMEAGLSGYSGAYDLEGRRVNLANLDFFWRLGRFDFTGEVVRVFIDPGFVQGFPESSEANTRSRVPPGMFGFYAQANARFRVEPLFRLLPEEWKEGHFTASLRYEEKDTDTEFVTAGDAARLTVGLNFRPIPPFVFKNSFHWEKTGASGEQPHLWSREFWRENEWTYIGSAAFLF
ncbi:MAG: hypothetical protein HYZ28_14275 [Myxococcales bacterium]|nr:hypothetical protein [Myxococcales bacterium]